MTGGSAAYFASCSAVVAASLVYVVPAFTPVPVLWYYPLAHAWAIEALPTGFALDWYGRTLWAVLAAILAFVVARAVAGRVAAPSPRAYRVWAVWAGMTSLLVMAVYSYQLAYRTPSSDLVPALDEAPGRDGRP